MTMRNRWILLARLVSSIALITMAGCASTSQGSEIEETQASTSAKISAKEPDELDVPQPQWKGQADRERFKKAHSLVGQKKFEEALELLKLNIEETPNAGDIDYSYAWSCVCLAELERFDESLRYYEIMCTRFYGTIRKGAGGAVRSWDDLLDKLKDAVRESSFTDKAQILEQMAKLDKTAFDSYLADAEKLIRSVSRGNKTAIKRLNGADYRDYKEAVLKLIELGRLRLAEQK
jgi:tetratricopeptide (TPR) repeat protein